MGGVANRIADDAAIDPFRLLRIIDFAETYAHRVHHGKEEEILFRELHAKDLESEHRQMMEVLAREHVEMRAFVHDLVEALEAYRGGDRERLSAIREALNGLIEIYPGHLEREEAEFFPTVEDYLDEDEMRVLMEAMAGHDRGVLHERYGRLVEALTGRAEDWELQE
jgi:hemerythrin-like domain-containing protein